MNGISRLLFVMIVAFLMGSASTYAQSSEGTAVSGLQNQIEGFGRQLSGYSQRVEATNTNDSALVEIRLELEKLEKAILESAVSQRPRMSEINSRLDQLGLAPAEGIEEPEVVAEERKSLLEEKAQLNKLLGEAETLSLQTNKVIENIGDLRRDLFAQSLSKRYDIGPGVLRNAAGAFADEVSELWKRFSSWFRFVVRFKLTDLLAATGLAAFAALVITFGLRRLAERLSFHPDGEDAVPTFLERITLAFWATIVPTLALGVFVALAAWIYDDYGLSRADLGEVVFTAMQVAIIVFLVHRLALLILSPWQPSWRLGPFSDRSALLLYWLTVGVGIVTGLDFIMLTVNDVLSSPLLLTVGKTLFATVLVALFVILIGLTKPFVDDDGSPRPWPRFIRVALFAIGSIPLIAALFGYVGLARFALQQIVVTGAILVTMYIGFLAAREMAAENALMNTAAGKRLQERFGLSDLSIEQIGVASGITTNLLVLAIGIPLILLQWGFHWGEMRAWALRVLDGFQVGSITISIYGILAGIAIFILAYIATRWFQRWLDGTVMARSKMDSGVRNSIRTAVGYVGIVIAVLIGISAAGIELQNLALVAGGLSLGIGFGLQNVVSNFVSGLILLAERPFKAGDWIEAGGVSGFVKKVKVRATEIETFQRQTIILPNSELINSAVGNWTHRNRLARIEIAVGVAYGTDAKKVRDILLRIAHDHPKVATNPEPMVLFANFGDSSLDFELRIFLPDIFDTVPVQTDIRFSILDEFEKERIEIPFPQRDLHIKGPGAEMAREAVEKGPGSRARSKPATTAKTTRRRRSKSEPPEGELGDNN